MPDSFLELPRALHKLNIAELRVGQLEEELRKSQKRCATIKKKTEESMQQDIDKLRDILNQVSDVIS